MRCIRYESRVKCLQSGSAIAQTQLQEIVVNSEFHQVQEGAGCGACRSGLNLGFELTMAFQPIVHFSERTVFAYEALVRGVGGIPAGQVLSRVNEENRYIFDQSCRVKAIELASKLGVPERNAKLSVNFMPGAVYSPAACIRRTLEAAREHAFPLDAIIFEITEDERVSDTGHMRRIAEEYARHGFTLALDDFGAGYSGLNLLAELDGIRLVKLDGKLIRGLGDNRRAQHVVASTTAMCRELGIDVLGECVETPEEAQALQSCGVELMQGYLFAKPALAALPEISWPGEQHWQAQSAAIARPPASFSLQPSLA